MQSWSLDKKIKVSETRILEWYIKQKGQVYVSFSGGKDSTVVSDLAAKVCKANDYKLVLWFSNASLEYPEVVQHVKEFPNWIKNKYGVEVELVMDFPKTKEGKRLSFREVVLGVGYPIISKEVSKVIYDARSAIVKGNESTSYAIKQLNGEQINSKTGELSSRYNRKKWQFLLDAPFKVSHRCCELMKKSPAHKFDKQSGLKPIIGTMAEESRLRKGHWFRHGCNVFDVTSPASKPLSFWKEQDVLEYIDKFQIPIPSVYGEILKDENGKYITTGCSRTGCIYCAFGCHLEKEPNRFQRLKETHPKLWEYCMKPVSDGGLGMKEVLEYIGVKYE